MASFDGVRESNVFVFGCVCLYCLYVCVFASVCNLMTLTIFNGSSIRANLPSRGAREKIKKIITGQKLILEMLEPIKKQQNEMQNCVLSDFGNDSF